MEILTHKSAIELSRFLRSQNQTYYKPCSIKDATCRYYSLAKNLKVAGLINVVSIPYDMLVVSRNQRNKVKRVNEHFSCLLDINNSTSILSTEHKILTDSPFALKINEDIGIISPEFLFLMLVQSQGPIFALLAGLEMCGTYCINSEHTKLVSNLPQLTSANNVQNFLNNVSAIKKGLNHIKVAKKYSRYLIDGSASPQESKLYLKLALPESVGGWDLSNLLFNYAVPLSSRMQKLANRNVFYCDLANPTAKVAIEYDSLQHHSSYAEVNLDRTKKEVLQSIDWQVFTFTARELYRMDLFNEKANQIANALNNSYNRATSRNTKKYLQKAIS